MNIKKIKDISDGSNHRLIVKFKQDEVNLRHATGQNKSSLLAKGHKIKKIKDNMRFNFTVYDLEGGDRADLLIAKIRNRDDVEYAELDFQYQAFAIETNDTYRDYLWGLDNSGQAVNRGAVGTVDADIDAPEAWLISTGNNMTVVVAVIDSGVAYNHPDLTGRMWDGSTCLDHNGDYLGACQHGYNYANDDKFPLPYNLSHGTHVAGIIAANINNGEGIIGVAPNARIMALATDLYTSEIVESIAFAENNGAHIINASWGGGFFSQALYDAIASTNVLFVTAAGNNGANNSLSPMYPCDYDLDNILCVAASDRNDNLADFSNYGSSTVDLAAPGEDIFSTISLNIIYSENFESAAVPALPAGYTASGTWATATTSDPDWGNVLYGDSSRSPYSSNNLSTLTSPTIDLSGISAAYFDYWISCDTELNPYNDLFLFYFSANGIDYDIQDYWNEYWLRTEDESAGGVAYHFQEYAVISNTYKTSDFRFQLVWMTNGEDNDYDGCFLDKIEISEISDGGDGQYGFNSGTSMAAPYASGLAALLKSYNPNLTTGQLKDILIQTGDSLASMSNKTVSEKRINAYNALNLFRPSAGYEIENVIPSNKMNQLDDGSGLVTVEFKLKNGLSGLSAILSDFQYSYDNGGEWQNPTGTDSSSALSDSWQDNNYLFATDFSSTTYDFSLETKSNDLSGLADQDQSDIRIRFKVNDGATTSSWCVSEPFRVDNLPPDTPFITSPDQAMTVASSSFLLEGTAASGSLILVSQGASVLANVQMNASSTNFSVYVPLTEGDNILTVTASDNFGNQSEATSTAVITRDTISPHLDLASVGSFESAPYYASTSPVSATVSGENGMLCRWSTSSQEAYSIMTNDCSVDTATATCELLVAGDDGLKSYFISCRDIHGNENDADSGLSINLYLDTSPPSINGLTVSPHPSPSGTTTITIFFSEISGLDESFSPDVSVHGLFSSPYLVTQTAISTSTWTGFFVLTDDYEEATGSIMILNARDIMGNIMVATATAGIISVDSIPPTAALIYQTPESSTYETVVNIRVGGDDVAYYKYKINNGNYSNVISTGTAISLSGLAVGTHTLYVLGRDLAGNWQDNASIFSWQILSRPSSGGGGSSYTPRSTIETGVDDTDDEAIDLNDEIKVKKYIAADNTVVEYVYQNFYTGTNLDRLSVKAIINQIPKPVEDLFVNLQTEDNSRIRSVRLKVPSLFRQTFYAVDPDSSLVIGLEQYKASSVQRSESVRQGMYMFDYDVFAVTARQGDRSFSAFAVPITLEFDVRGIINHERLRVYYYNENLKIWQPLGQGGKVSEGWLGVIIDQTAEYSLMLGTEKEFMSLQDETRAESSGRAHDKNWLQVLADAQAVQDSGINLDGFLAFNGLKMDLTAQKRAMSQYTDTLVGKKSDLDIKSVYAINNFIVYGTPSTRILGSGERAGVINSYLAAFGKLPISEAGWRDCLAIGNGRWPGERSDRAESGAMSSFRSIYLREADMANTNDNAAVTVMAYGLRPANRNMSSEKAAIMIFKKIFGYQPSGASDWDAVRAIAYSGATR